MIASTTLLRVIVIFLGITAVAAERYDKDQNPNSNLTVDAGESGWKPIATTLDASTNRISAMNPVFGCRGDGRSNDYECFHRLVAYLRQVGGGTLYLPDKREVSVASFVGDYVCGPMPGAGNHNGCIEISYPGNVRVEFAPGARLVMKNLSNGGYDGSYHGIFVGDPSFSNGISGVELLKPRITWDPAPRRRTQGDGIHILGAPMIEHATRNVRVIDGEVQNAPQVGFGAFGTINAELKGFTSINSFGNGAIFSSTWAGSKAENITCKWTRDIGDDCVEVTAYYNLSNPLSKFVYNDGQEPFNSPDHFTRNNNGAIIRSVYANGGLADGLRLGGCFRCYADGITVLGKSVAGVILDSSVKGSTFLASIESTVKNVNASGNAENFLIFTNGEIKPKGHIQAIGIADSGSGYSPNTTCEIIGINSLEGRDSRCSVTIDQGRVNSISFTQSGLYGTAPSIKIRDLKGKGAELIATLSNEFLNFKDDYVTNLNLSDGKMDNLLVTGNVYGFSLGNINATSGQVRLSASDFRMETLDCRCSIGRGIYISGNTQIYPSPIDASTPFHNIHLGSVVNRAGPIEIRDTRGLTAHLLESDESSGRPILIERVLDTTIDKIKIAHPNPSQTKSINEALLIETAHRLSIGGVQIISNSESLVPFSVGGGYDLDKSEQISIDSLILTTKSTVGGMPPKLQTGPFAPVGLKVKYGICSAGTGSPIWKTIGKQTPSVDNQNCQDLGG